MLNVWVANEISGGIDRHSEAVGDYVFAYGLKQSGVQEVSLTMPYSLQSYPYHHGLHPVFQMNLPEGRLRESLERTFRKQTQGFDQLSLLEVVGASQIGRLRFSNTPQTIDQVPLQSVSELIAYDGTEDLLHDLLARFSTASGISGVQPKVLIRDQVDEVGRVSVKGATHIVKGWDASDYPQLATNEYFCMTVAQRAGLKVTPFWLSQNKQFLVLERFDLGADGQYLGFEDFCSLNGLGTEAKYDSSYEKLAKRIREFVSPTHRNEALEIFFRSLVVSCVLKNGDAHLKNFGVLYEAADKPVCLAPAYDIVTTTAYIKGDSLALTLGGSKRFPNAQKLLNFAKLECGLQLSKATAILEEVAEAVLLTLQDVKTRVADQAGFKVTGTAMIQQWKEGLNLSCAKHLVGNNL